MKTVSQYFDRIEKVVSNSIFAFVLVIMVWQVVARVFFRIPNAWSEELTRYMFFGFVFFATSYAINQEAHIKMDGLLRIYPAKMRIFVALLGYAILFAYCIFVAYSSGLFTYSAFKMGQKAPSLQGVSMWVFYITMPVAHVFMMIRIIQVMIRIVRRKTYEVPNE
jgi:TRAP-type C4-dicarboxylate transport system permease small subunit